MSPADYSARPRFDGPRLTAYTAAVFEAVGATAEDAAIVAEVLVTSDLRGIDSHGVPRLPMYLRMIEAGVVNLSARPEVLHETPATIAVDAHNGLGHPASHWAMTRCIEKASAVGVAFATVRHSNHFGIAGYYAAMALERDLAGMAMTNATPLVVPTFGRDPMLGTNPIGIAVPAGAERPFVLDVATSAVAWGKVEIARREAQPMPLTWAVDEAGLPTSDPIAARYLQPLGGARENSGQKGYGFGAFVEIMCGPLAGAAISLHVAGSRTEPPRPSGTGHFFAAWRPDAFRPLDEFRADMDAFLHGLRTAEPAPGCDRVYVAGDPEAEAEEERRARGIPLHPLVVDELEAIGQRLGVPFDCAV